jgi:predicted nucleic acid-binding protein
MKDDSSRCLIDSNILLLWARPSLPSYPKIAEAMKSLARRKVDLCYTSQNLGEFWNPCTRPSDRNGFGLSPDQTHKRARSFERRLGLLPESLLVHQEWRRLLIQYQVSGVQVHDARLVAAMHVHKIGQILTLNVKDFARFTTIEALLPESVYPPTPSW